MGPSQGPLGPAPGPSGCPGGPPEARKDEETTTACTCLPLSDSGPLAGILAGSIAASAPPRSLLGTWSPEVPPGGLRRPREGHERPKTSTLDFSISRTSIQPPLARVMQPPLPPRAPQNPPERSRTPNALDHPETPESLDPRTTTATTRSPPPALPSVLAVAKPAPAPPGVARGPGRQGPRPLRTAPPPAVAAGLGRLGPGDVLRRPRGPEEGNAQVLRAL